MRRRKTEAVSSPSAWRYRGAALLFGAALLVSHGNPASGNPNPRLVSSGPDFPGRTKHAAAAVGRELYVIGGYDGRNPLNDVWKSSDGGSRWIQVLPDTPSLPNTQFGGRFGHAAAAVGGELYVIGGHDGRNPLNDVWKSSDGGGRWIQVSADTSSPTNTQFGRRFGHATAAVGGELYVIGGYDGRNPLNDVWKSSDGGSRWIQVLPDTPSPTNTRFGRRNDHAALTAGYDLYVIGGYSGESFLNDVWKSSDGGGTWIQVLPDTPKANTRFGGRLIHAGLTVGDELYVIGGHDGTNRLNDVWKSSDGGSRWIQVLPDTPSPTNTQFGRRFGHAAAAAGGELYVIGGHDGTNRLNDVWKSSDGGARWIQVLPDTPGIYR